MKKRIAILLSAIMVFLSAVPALAVGRDALDSLVHQLAGYTPDYRKSVVENLAAFSGGEANLEMACEQIDAQSGAMYDLVKPIVDQVGAETVKAMIRSIAAFGCRNMNFALYAYADAKVKPEPLKLGTEGREGMSVMLNVLAEANPEMGVMLETDGINESVLGYMMKTILQDVQSNELFLYDEDDAAFSLNSLSSAFEDKLNGIWNGVALGGETVTARGLMNSTVALLNSYVNKSEGKTLAEGLKELGLCKINKRRPTGGGGGGTGTKPGGTVNPGTTTPPETEQTIGYERVDAAEGLTDELLENGVIIKAGVSVEGAIDTGKAFEKPAIIRLDLTGENLMMYRFENGALTPVKYSAVTDGGYVALIERGGYYVVKDMSYAFDDVAGWSRPFVEGLYLRGIISGKGEAVFMPGESITREEFVKLVVELFGLTDKNASVDFTDVDPNAWYYPYVATAASKNIVNGIGDGKFGVGQKIKRQDMAKIIEGVLASQGIKGASAAPDTFADFASVSDYARESVLAVCGLGIVNGDENKNFNPNHFATREEAAKMIYGMLTAYLQSMGK